MELLRSLALPIDSVLFARVILGLDKRPNAGEAIDCTDTAGSYATIT